MSLEALRLLARLHAASAWAAIVLLAAAAFAHLGDRARRAATWLAGAAAAITLLAAGLGFAIHDGYRARLRQRLFLQAASLGWLFERKLHLAFAAVMLAVAGAALTVAERRAAARPGGEAAARTLRTGAATAWCAAAALALIAALASVIVARRASF